VSYTTSEYVPVVETVLKSSRVVVFPVEAAPANVVTGMDEVEIIALDSSSDPES
jgi:hypothetical protein